MATDAGVAEYKRIFMRNQEFGVTHMVYGPRNTRHSIRTNDTDGWGWGEVLWFSMGQRLREGLWDPRSDPVPQDILDMVAEAGAHDIKLMAYVYPCLAFKGAPPGHLVPDVFNSLDLSPPEVQPVAGSAEHLIATKALRCHGYGLVPHCR